MVVEITKETCKNVVLKHLFITTKKNNELWQKYC